MNTTATAATLANLAAMSTDALDALTDAIYDGTVTVVGIDAGVLFDACLTERYRVGRADRVAVLPLDAAPAPANVADLVLFA